jgi:hypothetical protein
MRIAMPTIELDSSEFSQLMFVLSSAEGKGISWGLVNPLIMKIGEQVRVQAVQSSRVSATPSSITRKPRDINMETSSS